MGAELTAKFAFCSILEHGFGDIIVYEWIQTGVKNTRNRRFFNVVLATSLYMNGFKQVSKPDPGHGLATLPTLPYLAGGSGLGAGGWGWTNFRL